MARRGPMTEDELLKARIRRYLRAQGFRLETVGQWERVDSAFAVIVVLSERERHLAEILLTDPRSLLDATEDTGSRIYIEVNREKVSALREAKAGAR